MNAPDIREVEMTKPTFAEVCADAYAPTFGPPVLWARWNAAVNNKAPDHPLTTAARRRKGA